MVMVVRKVSAPLTGATDKDFMCFIVTVDDLNYNLPALEQSYAARSTFQLPSPRQTADPATVAVSLAILDTRLIAEILPGLNCT